MFRDIDLPRGTRVTTPIGAGSVCWIRMAPPAFNTVEAVSVLLDEYRDRAVRGDYHGTVFPAEQITLS